MQRLVKSAQEAALASGAGAMAGNAVRRNAAERDIVGAGGPLAPVPRERSGASDTQPAGDAGRGAVIAAFAGAPAKQEPPGGLNSILKRADSAGFGSAAGLTLIKGAGAFKAPEFRTTNVAERRGYRVSHFADVEPATAADVTHESFYPAVGDHLRTLGGKATQKIRGKLYTHYTRVGGGIAALIRQGEQEHLDDARRAHEMTYGLIAERINALVGRRFGPASTPDKAHGLAKSAMQKALPAQPRSPTKWAATLDALLVMTVNRDKKNWHAIDSGPSKIEGEKIVWPLSTSGTTKIGEVGSKEVVKYPS